MVVGDTTLEVAPVTEPILLSKDRDVALLTVQDKVEDDPELILAGDAVNELIVGAETDPTVTVAWEVIDPELFVAVRV